MSDAERDRSFSPGPLDLEPIIRRWVSDEQMMADGYGGAYSGVGREAAEEGDVPALIAEVRRLREEFEKLRSTATWHEYEYGVRRVGTHGYLGDRLTLARAEATVIQSAGRFEMVRRSRRVTREGQHLTEGDWGAWSTYEPAAIQEATA